VNAHRSWYVEEVVSEAPRLPQDVATLEREVAERDALIASLRSTIARFEGQVAALQSALVNHATEIELLKRRLFGPRSERGGTSELQLLLGDMLAQQAALQKQLDDALAKKREGEEAKPPPPPPAARPKPKGRRDLSASSLPTIMVDLTDPELAKKGRLIGYDESRQLLFERGGFKVLVKRMAKYELEVAGKTTVLGTPAPKTLFARGLLHTSALAWLGVQKFSLGTPCYRLEQDLRDQGQSLDRGTMCRNLEEVGNVLGATVVHAMMRDAAEHCAVLSTDASGAAIQPGPREGAPKRACKKGHFCFWTWTYS